MPVAWSGTLDFLNRFQPVLGTTFISFLLRRWEEEVAKKAATVSPNKVDFPAHLWIF
jgi:hypothetical protein